MFRLEKTLIQECSQWRCDVDIEKIFKGGERI